MFVKITVKTTIMKTIKAITTTLMCGMFLLTSCEKNNSRNNIDDAIYLAFEREFPGATDVTWTINGNYAIASFDWNGSRSNNSTDYTAWFEKNTAEFMMHEYDISFSSLPQTVRNAFNESVYSKSPWKYENEVDVIIRKADKLTLYIIEAEKEEKGTETEVDLYYSEEGVLVKEIFDAYENPDFTELLPSQPTNDIYSLIEEKYPEAKIIEIDNEDGYIEVEFIRNNTKHEAIFTSKNEWIYTKIDYNRNLSILPETIVNYISSNYASYYIEDIEFYETESKGNFYSIEVENNHDNDIELFFTEEGEVLNYRPDFRK